MNEISIQDLLITFFKENSISLDQRIDLLHILRRANDKFTIRDYNELGKTNYGCLYIEKNEKSGYELDSKFQKELIIDLRAGDNNNQKIFVLLHEILHNFYLHYTRFKIWIQNNHQLDGIRENYFKEKMEHRLFEIWNIASDCIINQILYQLGFDSGTLEALTFSDLVDEKEKNNLISLEFIWDIIRTDKSLHQSSLLKQYSYTQNLSDIKDVLLLQMHEFKECKESHHKFITGFVHSFVSNLSVEKLFEELIKNNKDKLDEMLDNYIPIFELTPSKPGDQKSNSTSGNSSNKKIGKDTPNLEKIIEEIKNGTKSLTVSIETSPVNRNEEAERQKYYGTSEQYKNVVPLISVDKIKIHKIVKEIFDYLRIHNSKFEERWGYNRRINPTFHDTNLPYQTEDFITGQEMDYTKNIFIYIDVSGSVSDNDFSIALEITHTLMETFNITSNVQVLFFNSKIIKTLSGEEYINGENYPQGGGTNFDIPISDLNKKAHFGDKAIIITDGQCRSSTGHNHDIIRSTIWILHNRNDVYPDCLSLLEKQKIKYIFYSDF